MEYSDQILRIKKKLQKAKELDKEFSVFGASSHKYFLAEPATEEQIAAFEEKYEVTLPTSYRAFLTQVGNGGISYANSGAGPYYGIYPLGRDLETSGADKYMMLPVHISPTTTEEEWDNMTERAWGDESNLSDKEYEEEMGKIFGGTMPIGWQGCGAMHTIVLNGPFADKVVYLDNMEKPKFTHETHFLDWYERWLDEIISGKLISRKATWFAYSKKED